MCKAIYWGFMSVVSWLLAPVKMRYPSNPFWCLTLSNFKYAQCPDFFHIQHRLCLFYLFHHIQSPGDINFKDIKLKKKKKRYIFIINTEKWTLHSFANQFWRYSKVNTYSSNTGLILKKKSNSVNVCMRHCIEI